VSIIHHRRIDPASLTDVVALNVTATACELPVRDIHKKFDILNIVMSAITVLAVLLRIFQKLRFERSLRLDDYLIVVCMVSEASLHSHAQPLTSTQATSIGNTVSCVFGRTYPRSSRFSTYTYDYQFPEMALEETLMPSVHTASPSSLK